MYGVDAFEYPAPPSYPPASLPPPPTALNTLVFVSGFVQGPLEIPYLKVLASRLPSSWRLIEPRLSSYTNHGFRFLRSGDSHDLTFLLEHIQEMRPEGKVVIMGHASGCQKAVRFQAAFQTSLNFDGVYLASPDQRARGA